ncbi:MAG TPA: hypothetical protein VF730_01200 [Terracidiphilus sp.]
MSYATADIPNVSSAGRRVGSSRCIVGLAAALIFTAGGAFAAHAQITTIQNGGRGPQNSQMPAAGSFGPTIRFANRRIRQLNVERQKEMVSDTDKLVRLIADLNTDVARNHSTEFTPDQLRMLARIEKLAKSVKEKMSNPVQGTIFEDNFPPPMGPTSIP